MKIGIVGSRHYFDYERFVAKIEPLLPIGTTAIVSGGAKGVDALAKRYALESGLEYEEYSTDSETGPFPRRARSRNAKIAAASDRLIALPCGCSRGTWMTLSLYGKRPWAQVHPAAILRVNC